MHPQIHHSDVIGQIQSAPTVEVYLKQLIQIHPEMNHTPSPYSKQSHNYQPFKTKIKWIQKQRKPHGV